MLAQNRAAFQKLLWRATHGNVSLHFARPERYFVDPVSVHSHHSTFDFCASLCLCGYLACHAQEDRDIECIDDWTSFAHDLCVFVACVMARAGQQSRKEFVCDCV